MPSRVVPVWTRRNARRASHEIRSAVQRAHLKGFPLHRAIAGGSYERGQSSTWTPHNIILLAIRIPSGRQYALAFFPSPVAGFHPVHNLVPDLHTWLLQYYDMEEVPRMDGTTGRPGIYPFVADFLHHH